MFKYLLLSLTLITGVALAAGRLQNADFMSAAQITGAGGTVSQLLNTSKIFDSTNSQLLDTTIAGKQPTLSSSAAVANQFVTGFTAPNTFTRAQPAFTDLSGSIATGQIPANVVSNSKLAQMAAHTFKGNNTAVLADPIDLTQAQLTAELNQFTSLLQGVVPASGGGTVNFLRADGTWAPPSGTGTVTSVDMSVPAFLSVSGNPITGSGTLAVTLSGTALPIANGGTGQTTANAALNALLPSQGGNSGKFLTTDGSNTSWATAGGGGSGEAMEKDITQASHGFAVGDVVYLNSTTYTKAKADADSTSEVIGVVSAVADANNFTLTTGGFVSGLSGLTAGSTYFLSPSTAGAVTTTEPTTSGQISKPIYVAASTTTAYVVQHRGAIIGSGSSSGQLSEVWSHTANGYGSTNTNTPRFSTTTTSGTNITADANNATLGNSYTINATGTYSMSGTHYNQSTNAGCGFTLNQATPTQNIVSVSTSERIAIGGTQNAGGGADEYCSAAVTKNLNAGDVIRFVTNGQTAATASRSLVIITQVR